MEGATEEIPTLRRSSHLDTMARRKVMKKLGWGRLP